MNQKPQRTQKTFEELFQVLGLTLNGRNPEDVPREEIDGARKKLAIELHDSKMMHATPEVRAAAADRLAEVNSAHASLKSRDAIGRHRAAIYQEDMIIRRGEQVARGARDPFEDFFNGTHRSGSGRKAGYDDFFKNATGNTNAREEMYKAAEAMERKVVFGTVAAAAVVGVGAVIYKVLTRKKSLQEQLVQDVNNQARYGTIDVQSMGQLHV